MVEVVVVGGITEDLIILPNKESTRYIGGVPVYAASTAKALGKTVGIVSKVGTDFHLNNLETLNSLGADLDGFKITGNSSMRFENKYSSAGKRTQKILSISEQITFDDIPEQYFSSPYIHLGPVFNEIDPLIIHKLREKFDFISLDAQGFLRKIDTKSQKITLQQWENFEEYFSIIDVVKVDDIELKALTGISRLKEATELVLETKIPILIITRAHKGALVYQNGKQLKIPAFPTEIKDETGAGDTFITAFLFEYQNTKDCYHSAILAAATASCKIASKGPIPDYTRKDIIKKIKSLLPDYNIE